jgi:protein-disulfide isomerase
MKGLLRSRTAVFAAVGAIAAAIAVALILVSVVGSNDKKASPTTAPLPTTGQTSAAGTAKAQSTKVPGAAETAKLFRGIPQRLNQLGNPNAPVTLIEFADLQCPFCREYAVNALPPIVDEYVRPGKVKLVFGGIAFLGPDSETALRAAYAAGLQSRLWNFVDLLYRNQGPENSGWVTDALLQSVGESIPGLDADAMMAARQSQEVEAAIGAMQQQADSAHVNSTPSFFLGPTGGTLQSLHVSSLTADAFRPALDKLVK